ncbi:GH92 family glycosyl hydrolase [Odoribacter laneus]|uniref:GH92 family glycosyl hydrolase n=1 Tax=Odoribacter laneus TaxID=626933 RepID=UPI000335F311|nr:GH92 family glycosyl hydrolase [Odoribacter laneus]CCZ80048.1 putative alpha-1 2-mannosidase [Odoribacter laneus CAG:561]
MRKQFILLLVLAGWGAGTWGAVPHEKKYADYVNPLMGTLSEIQLSTGNTYPAIARPWGMNFWMPQTGKMGNGWAYVYDHYRLRGFKQTHQPSPWINDYGQFSIMPVVGNKITEEERASWFSHKAEIAKPYYYSVYLAEHDILTEITPTERAAFFRMTFPESDESRIVIDAFDRGSYIRILPEENKIIGYTTRNSGGVPQNFKNYFVILLDKPLVYYAVWKDGKLCEGKELTDNHVGAIIGFKTRRGEKIHARVASSFIGFEQAERNLEELGELDFDGVKAEGEKVWNKVLGVFEIEADLDQMRTFYSCLYRSVLFPRMFYEYGADGKPVHYSPYNGKILPGYLFTDTGFWDTFRCLFPLLNFAYPAMNAKIQEGLLNTYKESGFLPEWASPGHRGCMVGNNSASVVSDAILKDITPREYHLPLYEAMLATANSCHPKIKSTGRYGYEYYNKLGYVPYNVGIKESAARTLEYAYDDWCIAQVGKKLGRPQAEIDLYLKRSQNYRHLFDPEHNLMRGKNEDGTFQSPFNPLKWGDAFTEGNSWHYTWSVFHDVQGLIRLMGGNQNFVGMLDSVFQVPPLFDDSYYGGVIHEIREMQIMNMGNYAHGNQPIQHMIYLYNYAGEPWKAQYWLRQTMDRMYRPTPDGYCGDEDNGQTSAWYVFSSLGFYPVCPGSDQYVLGSPLIRKARIHLENGKEIVITASDNRADTPYVKELKLNGKTYGKNYLRYGDLQKGAVLNFRMDNKPDRKRGIGIQAYPYSYSE